MKKLILMTVLALAACTKEDVAMPAPSEGRTDAWAPGWAGVDTSAFHGGHDAEYTEAHEIGSTQVEFVLPRASHGVRLVSDGRVIYTFPLRVPMRLVRDTSVAYSRRVRFSYSDIPSGCDDAEIHVQLKDSTGAVIDVFHLGW